MSIKIAHLMGFNNIIQTAPAECVLAGQDTWVGAQLLQTHGTLQGITQKQLLHPDAPHHTPYIPILLQGERQYIMANAHSQKKKAWYLIGKVGGTTYSCPWSWCSSTCFLQMLLNELNFYPLTFPSFQMYVNRWKSPFQLMFSWVICLKWERNRS